MLLQQPADEFGDTAAEAVQQIVSNTTFQLALLACIAELVSFAGTRQLRFPALTARLNALGCIMAMWEALLYVQHTLLKVGHTDSKVSYHVLLNLLMPVAKTSQVLVAPVLCCTWL